MFIETIKIENGKIKNLKWHLKRIKKTQIFFYKNFNLTILDNLVIPQEYREGIIKCRIIYSIKIENIEYIPYTKPIIKSLKIIHDNNINYSFKSINRKKINDLLKQKQNADDILIIKNNFVTDTSFTNIIFSNNKDEYFTPSTYLLNGTQRQNLLNKKIITKKEITINDINLYKNIILINAMLDLESKIKISIDNIIF